jgi:hypothetical protein
MGYSSAEYCIIYTIHHINAREVFYELGGGLEKADVCLEQWRGPPGELPQFHLGVLSI